MRFAVVWVGVTLNVVLPGLLPAEAYGDQGGGDAMEWVSRIYNASQHLSYTGTFVYQEGSRTETARIARLVDPSGTRERVEVLDGSPREIIRAHGKVECYLPDSMTVKIEKWENERSLLPILPTSSNIAGFYSVRKGDAERISGFDCQSVILEPKDSMRYGHKFWADSATGMLLKAQTLSEHGDVLEQFVFTQLKIGGRISRDDLVPHYKNKPGAWRIEESAAHPADLSAIGWTVGAAPPGYVKLAEMKRMFGNNSEVGHIVLSDGLSAVSIFIEQAGGQPNVTPIGLSRAGAFNVYKRKLDDYFVTAVGEAPAESVRTIANGMEYRH
jgi:sigma-E factor negative regulatory protein RseB